MNGTGSTAARTSLDAAANETSRRQELEELAFQQTKPLRDMILVLEDKVRAAEDCQAEVETLSTQKAALRKEVDKLREQRQADLRTFTLEVDEQKLLAEQLRQELASTQDAYRDLTIQESAR